MTEIRNIITKALQKNKTLIIPVLSAALTFCLMLLFYIQYKLRIEQEQTLLNLVNLEETYKKMNDLSDRLIDLEKEILMKDLPTKNPIPDGSGNSFYVYLGVGLGLVLAGVCWFYCYPKFGGDAANLPVDCTTPRCTVSSIDREDAATALTWLSEVQTSGPNAGYYQPPSNPQGNP